MRIYLDEQEKQLAAVICNGCKKELTVENGIVKEGCFQADTIFGYFSKKDGIRHRFDLCEDCYDRLAAGLKIPVQGEEVKELL